MLLWHIHGQHYYKQPQVIPTGIKPCLLGTVDPCLALGYLEASYKGIVLRTEDICIFSGWEFTTLSLIFKVKSMCISLNYSKTDRFLVCVVLPHGDEQLLDTVPWMLSL